MRAAHGWVPCRNYSCWWLGFLPGGSLQSLADCCKDFRTQSPCLCRTPLRGRPNFSAVRRLPVTSVQSHATPTSFLGRAQLLLLVNRYCSQEWSLVNLAASMLIAVCFWGAQPERVGRCVLISFISPRFGTDWQEQSFDFFL